MRSDVMAARVVGIRQEGESLPDGTVQEGRGARGVQEGRGARAQAAAMMSQKKSAAVNCRAGGAQLNKEKREQSKPRHF